MFSMEKALSRAKPTTEQKTVNFTDKWVNELKSTMILKQSGNEVSGSYESAVSADGTKAQGELHGYINGDLISFVVRWKEFDAITAWVGQLDPAGGTLVTLWQMTKQVETGEEWTSINTGSDTFLRTS